VYSPNSLKHVDETWKRRSNPQDGIYMLKPQHLKNDVQFPVHQMNSNGK